jgi:membrane dipeptidase
VIPVFDGHNDALTREDHARLAAGREGGHLDLPRMRAGGMRGGIFALFTPSPGEEEAEGHLFGGDGEDGTFSEPLAEPVTHEVAAADATAAAGRLFELERAGELTVARTIGDIDAALSADAPPVAVLHLEGAEAIDPGLEALPAWHAMGLRSLGPVWSRANDFATGVQFVFPSSPDIGPGLTDAGAALVRACAELGILVDLSHLNEKGFWAVARLESGPLVASHSGAHAVAAASRNLTDRSSTRSGRAAAWSGSSTRPPSSAPTSPTIPIRRSRRSPPTAATSPTGSASSTSVSAPTSTAPRSRPSSATSPACRASSTPSAPSASPTPSWRRSPGTTGAASSPPGGASPAVPC